MRGCTADSLEHVVSKGGPPMWCCYCRQGHNLEVGRLELADHVS